MLESPGRAIRRRVGASALVVAATLTLAAGCAVAPLFSGFLYERHERVPPPPTDPTTIEPMPSETSLDDADDEPDGEPPVATDAPIPG